MVEAHPECLFIVHGGGRIGDEPLESVSEPRRNRRLEALRDRIEFVLDAGR